MNWGVNQDFFRQQLESGRCMVLVDALDEAPDRKSREAMSNLIQQAARVYSGNHFVVTARPQANVGKSALPGPEFDQVRIADLEWEAVESFLARWSAALFGHSPAQAEAHRRQLVEAVGSRAAIRRLARNPVMLTALAVLHWNNRRLPEQRAELYESIIKWLSQSRENREGRTTPERCVAVLQDLARAMQDHPQGRQVQVARQWAAQAISTRFREVAEAERSDVAERFLREEEIDSGIVISRGSDIRFWHLTFQEYLAARAISGLPDDEQHRLFLKTGRAYSSEWREVVFLVAGVLYQQGISKVDALFSAILNDLEQRSPNSGWKKWFRTKEEDIAAQARAVGLLGGVLQDLGPLRYRSTDPRLEANLRTILGIFKAEQNQTVEFKLRLEAAEALGQAGDPRLNGDNWAWIEPSTVRAGESPPREMNLPGYGIGRYPVTVEEFRRFVEDGGYDNPRWWRNGFPSGHHAPDKWDEQLQHANRPIVGVSWYEAMAYCEWQGVQLPVEAEWERAARGKDGRRYPWGDAEPNTTLSNYCESDINHPTPVGLYPFGATADGILDLAGNVWEWTTDWPAKGKTRVVKGGSWNANKWLLRSTARFGLDAGDRRANVGFRVRKST
jgi:formylglycine-generating enzyme required for sulfatase activity